MTGTAVIMTTCELHLHHLKYQHFSWGSMPLVWSTVIPNIDYPTFFIYLKSWMRLYNYSQLKCGKSYSIIITLLTYRVGKQ